LDVSFQASKWAADQKTGNPSAKSVLYALANYADFNGKVFASQQRLAEDTEQSVDSVQRRLKELERRGLIFRTPQTRLEKGRAAGSWSVSFTILLMDDLCISFALKHGYDPSAPVAGDGKSSAVSECENGVQEDQPVNAGIVPQIAAPPTERASENNGLPSSETPHRAADCGPVISGPEDAHRTADCGSNRTALLRHGIVNSEPIFPPTSRSSSPLAPALVEGSWQADFATFETIWPFTDRDAVHRIREKFRELPPEDRTDLLAAAHAYLADCKGKRKAPASARGFFANGFWRDWVSAGKGRKQREIGDTIFVRKDSDAWRAWLAHKGVRSMPTIRRMKDGKPIEGWEFPTLFPPARGSPSQAAE